MPIVIPRGLTFGQKVMHLWKQGWNEIPEVMGSAFYGFIGIGIGTYGTWRYYKEERYNHRYKTTFTIYRPDDERVSRIRRFEDSPQPTRTPGSLTSGSGSC
ncbi:hypothetical protein Ocin01_13127 [Orchesella cincta]|uniref:Uncharacterized protein n=1 Tax=Orchesella cincta TaxID=48709 RepID=A0A1D2MKI9_ORCCI|nr:hypothetical protein Ocin01_13127 [Orchesella cincta]